MSEEYDAKDRYRMDFVQEPALVPHFVEAEEDEEEAVEVEGEYYRISHVELQFRMRPHPDRYERTENPPGWIDTFDNTIIPDEVLDPMVSELEDIMSDTDNDTPTYYDPPEIENTNEYIEARKREIELALEGGKPLHFVGPDREKLQELATSDVEYFAILSIDLVNSTSLSIGMENERFIKMMQTYMMESSSLIHNFHGSILNIAGDGIVAYFPGPNVNGMHDNAIDCAISHVRLVQDGLNEVLKSYGYPTLNCRIGINSGIPDIIPEGDNDYNLLGTCINIATKLQESADDNEILLGETTVQNLHTRWRNNVVKVTEEKDWNLEPMGERYDIYSYRSD